MFLFRPRNPLNGNVGIVVKTGCAGACFGLRSPLTDFGGIVVNPKEAWLFCCDSHIHDLNMARQ